LNGASDFASLANIPVYCLNGTDDASQVIQNHFASPGFRMMCLSQRLFGAPILDIVAEWSASDNSIFRYKSGSDITIVSLNFSLRDALSIDTQLYASGVRSDVFHVNFLPGMNMEPLVESCAKTGKLIVVDDSKSVTKFSDVLVADLCMRGVSIKLLSFSRRGCSDKEYGANEDRFAPDFEKALTFSREK
jgi:transketolase C-terminal domain/subunit